MKILHLNERLSVRGGADVYLLRLIEQQKGRHELRLAVGFMDGTHPHPCEVIRCRGLDARRPLRGRLDRLLALVDAFVPDVIHVHNVMNPLFLEALGGCPVVMTVQDHRVFCPGRGKWTADGSPCFEPMAPALCEKCFDDRDYFDFIHELTRRRLSAIASFRLITLSTYVRDELRALGVPPERIVVIPPLLPPRARREADRDAPMPARLELPPSVFFVGRLASSKGIEDAIAAWRLSGTDLPLSVIGEGPERPRLDSGDPSIRWTGWVDHRLIPTVLRRAKALLMPSRWQEPFGIVGIEALAAGVPVVGWRSGGMADWLPERWMVPWGDVGALGERLRDVLAGDHGFVWACDPFEPEVIAARIDKLYCSVKGMV